ncbi:hydrogenase expression/formation C-terminal domain-containing protein, partial [Escherichia sp. SS-MK2]
TDSLLPPPIDGLMNGLPLAHELLAHVRNPDAQPHSINLTQLPISEADRLFLSRLCGPGNIQIRTIGYGESYINATGLRTCASNSCANGRPFIRPSMGGGNSESV